MSGWTGSRLRARDAGVLAQPYFEWAHATRFAYYGAAQWLPVLIELRNGAQFDGTALAFATLLARMQAEGADKPSWVDQIRVPAFYATRPARWQFPTTFVSVLATPLFLDDVYAGKAPADMIRRFELGSATRPGPLGKLPPPPTASRRRSRRPAPKVVSCVIDDGLAFAHERFCSDDGTTRIEYFWDQQVPSPIWGDWTYGREISKRDAVEGIDRRMADSRHAGLVDEDEVYRRSGQVDHALSGHKPLAAAATHGAHVMDLACRPLAPPPADDWPIIAVQLPTATVADTSGATLGPQVYNGLCYAIAKAETLADGGKPLPLVANVSYGTIAGPHDGSSALEMAMDELIACCASTLQVVLPAGNNHLSRCHAHFSLAPGQSRELGWRVLPDDWTESHLEIWLPPGSPSLNVTIMAPDGAASAAFGWGEEQQLLDGAGLVGLASYYPPGGADARAMLRLSLAPTADPRGVLPLAPAGLWRIGLSNPQGSGGGCDIDAWIQRDDTAPGYPQRGRQSYFDDPAYARYDDGGRAIDVDTHPLTVASYVRREGTLNAIATGARTIVVGGFRRVDRAPACYSASGPLPAPGRGQPSPHGPDAMLPSDDTASQRGQLAAGTRSGSCVAMNGTSVAAPQAARCLAERIANAQPNDRAALFAAAVATDPAGPRKPPAQRGGGGRLAQAPNRTRPRFDLP